MKHLILYISSFSSISTSSEPSKLSAGKHIGLFLLRLSLITSKKFVMLQAIILSGDFRHSRFLIADMLH